jgi:hypothetical protein
MKLNIIFLLAFGILLHCAGVTGVEAQTPTETIVATEQVYEPGHGALKLATEEAEALRPAWVGYWLNFMTLSFALGLLFVWKRVEARWVVGGIISTFLIAGAGVPALNLEPLSGLYSLIHIITWTPGLYFMIKNKPFMGENSLYKYWSGLITGVIIFSFIFDVRDTFIYLDHMLGIGAFS